MAGLAGIITAELVLVMRGDDVTDLISVTAAEVSFSSLARRSKLIRVQDGQNQSIQRVFSYRKQQKKYSLVNISSYTSVQCSGDA